MMLSAISDYSRDTTWFAARTRSRQEKSAATMLQAVDIPTFLPLISEVHRWSDRDQTVTTPMFKGYVFVRLGPAREPRIRLLKTPGIAGLVGNQSGPLPIPDSEIDNIRTVLSRKLQYLPHPFLTVGERVRVVRGPLAGVEGTLVRAKANFKLVISVEMIQQSVAINIQASDVESAERLCATN